MSTKPAQNFLLFLIGGSLFAAGVFLFTNQVMVSSGLAGFAWGGRGAGGGLGGGLLLQSLLRFGAEDRTRRQEEVREERQTLQELRDELEDLKAKINRR